MYQAMTRTTRKANSEMQAEDLGEDDELNKVIQKLHS